MTHEKNITRLIIIIPILFLIAIVVATILLSINLIEKHYEYDIEKAEVNELKLQKQFIKTQIESVHNYIEQKKIEAPRRLKERLKQRVYTGLNIAQKIYENKQGKVSEEELREEILETLRKVRYGKDGYYFIAEMTADNVILSRMLPATPNKENIPAQNIKDVDGFEYVKAFAKTVQDTSNNEGFVEYKWYKLSHKEPYSKISFVKLFKPYNWFIGYGEYYDDFNQNIKKEAARRLDLFSFSTNGYVWTHDTNHTLIQHPFRKEAIGESDFELEDKKGNKIIQQFVKSALENKEGAFVEYYWNKPNELELTKKIGYVKFIEDWNWVIGTGVYLEDIKFSLDTIKQQQSHDTHESIINLLILSSIILFFAIISSYFVSRKINETLFRYRNKLLNKQEELEELNNCLEQKIQEKTKELQTLNSNLEKTIEKRVEEIKDKDKKLLEQSKMVALGEMIGNISHQWRQPLSAISTSASGIRLKQDMGILKEEDISEFSTAIVENANYLSQVIEDFKNYIKGDKAKKPFLLHEPIEKALNIVNSSIRNHNLNVIKSLETNLKIESFENELVQALVNILTNSKDAYVIQQVPDDDRYILIDAFEHKNHARIIIKDNAKGIEEKMLSKIFEPYFTTKDKNQGTGLGLYMTYQIIVESIQGQISVSNTEYTYDNKTFKGIQFIIDIPLN